MLNLGKLTCTNIQSKPLKIGKIMCLTCKSQICEANLRFTIVRRSPVQDAASTLAWAPALEGPAPAARAAMRRLRRRKVVSFHGFGFLRTFHESWVEDFSSFMETVGVMGWPAMIQEVRFYDLNLIKERQFWSNGRMAGLPNWLTTFLGGLFFAPAASFTSTGLLAFEGGFWWFSSNF